MERTLAINRLVEFKLIDISAEERAEQLEIMMLECWSESEDWTRLSNDVRIEFDGQELKFSPDSNRYDDVLKIWIRDELLGTTNQFMIDELKLRGVEVELINGSPYELFSCPCCGRKSLEELASWNICRVCWWEDNGQDNGSADIVMGGPNYGISLVQARYNFLTKGLYNPARADLFKLKEPDYKYEVGRIFKLISDSEISEPSVKLTWSIEPHA
jgi:hypothetical protein